MYYISAKKLYHRRIRKWLITTKDYGIKSNDLGVNLDSTLLTSITDKSLR